MAMASSFCASLLSSLESSDTKVYDRLPHEALLHFRVSVQRQLPPRRVKLLPVFLKLTTRFHGTNPSTLEQKQVLGLDRENGPEVRDLQRQIVRAKATLKPKVFSSSLSLSSLELSDTQVYEP